MFISGAAEGREGVNTSHSACRSHSRQAGSAEADLWPLRKGMWKLFRPGQKLKTPGQLESGSSILLSAFLIRGSKQRFSVNVLWVICLFTHFQTLHENWENAELYKNIKMEFTTDYISRLVQIKWMKDVNLAQNGFWNKKGRQYEYF